HRAVRFRLTGLKSRERLSIAEPPRQRPDYIGVKTVRIDELKSKVESYRTSLKDKSGKPCIFGESGPVGMSVIDALVAMIESQQREIDELRNAPARMGR